MGNRNGRQYKAMFIIYSLYKYIFISTVSNSSLARSGYLLQTFQISAGASIPSDNEALPSNCQV